MKPPRLVRSLVTVGGWTMLSRIFGFVRDVMVAAALGAGPVADAFVVAFSLPNMFRRFFAEGAFNMAFVPMFAKKLEGGDGAGEFARDAMTGLATVLIVFTALAMVAMPVLVYAMASGFAGDDRFDLTVVFGRIAFPYILFISLAALCSGVLNATGRFRAAAAAPVLLNAMFIAALLVGAQRGWDMGLTLVWTVPFAGIAQLALVWIAAHRAGFTILPRIPRLTPELKRLAIIAAPAALAGGVVQVNLLVGRQVASFTEGANMWLYIADRLYQLPLGVVGIAVGIVLLPELARRLRANDTEGSREAYNRAAEICLLLTIPAAVALMVIPGSLVGVLFGRGNFTAADVGPTALATAIYGLGLPAFVLQKVLQPLYFAREDTRSPFRFAVVAMVINAVLAIGLSPFIGYLAAAVGASVAGWGMLFLLLRGTGAMGEATRLDARLISRVPKIFVASAVMGLGLWGGEWWLADMLAAPGLRYVALGLLIALGGSVYLWAGTMIGAFFLADLRGALRR